MQLKELMKEKAQQIKNGAGLYHHTGVQLGAEAGLKLVDGYRRISGPCWFLAAMLLFFAGEHFSGLVSLGIAHLHVIINQIWWKACSVEALLVKKEP